MAKKLEVIAEGEQELDDSLAARNLPSEDNSVYMSNFLDYFTDSIKDKKRREEVRAEMKKVFSNYLASLKRDNPLARRGALLEESYRAVPTEEEIGDKDPREVLQKRLYANPGRQYQYLNGVVGNKKKSAEVKYELGRAAQYTLREGWPVLGAGTGWWLANNWYKRQVAKGLTGRLTGAFNNKWWEYLIPGAGQARTGIDAGKFLAKEGLKSLWGIVRTPLQYAIGAYAVYKTLGYFLKRRREKKLEHEQIERLEGMRHNMLSQTRALGDQQLPALA